MLLLYEVPRVVKHKLDHIMICSKYDYSFETLILWLYFPEVSAGNSSLVPFPIGDTVVSLTSLSEKSVTDYQHIQILTASVIRYFFKLKMEQRKGEKKEKDVDIFLR